MRLWGCALFCWQGENLPEVIAKPQHGQLSLNTCIQQLIWCFVQWSIWIGTSDKADGFEMLACQSIQRQLYLGSLCPVSGAWGEVLLEDTPSTSRMKMAALYSTIHPKYNCRLSVTDVKESFKELHSSRLYIYPHKGFRTSFQWK